MNKSFKQLNLNDRKLIESLLKLGFSHRSIAISMERENSSISREIKDNSVNNEYSAIKADHKAYLKRYHAKYQQTKIKNNSKIEKYVINGLEQNWSPDQISGRMKLDFSENQKNRDASVLEQLTGLDVNKLQFHISSIVGKIGALNKY